MKNLVDVILAKESNLLDMQDTKLILIIKKSIPEYFTNSSLAPRILGRLLFSRFTSFFLFSRPMRSWTLKAFKALPILSGLYIGVRALIRFESETIN
jgi:hypothetical protein